MEWMERELRQAKDDGRLAALYFEGGDPARFHAGYVLDVDSQCCVLAGVSPHGEWDGYLLRRLEGLAMVETGGRDLDRLAFLLKDQNQAPLGSGLDGLPGNDDSLFQSVLSHLMRDPSIVMLGLDTRDDLLAGYLVGQDGGIVRMQTVHHAFGEDDGQVVFPRQSVDLVEWGSRECQTIERLRKWNR